MGADPKPTARRKDPALLRRIHAAYQHAGCSYCGRKVSEDAPPGFQIEVHHIVGRGRGDDSWENTVGLCGELAGCRMHHLVTMNLYKLYRADGSLWISGADTLARLVQLGEV